MRNILKIKRNEGDTQTLILTPLLLNKEIF